MAGSPLQQETDQPAQSMNTSQQLFNSPRTPLSLCSVLHLSPRSLSPPRQAMKGVTFSIPLPTSLPVSTRPSFREMVPSQSASSSSARPTRFCGCVAPITSTRDPAPVALRAIQPPPARTHDRRRRAFRTAPLRADRVQDSPQEAFLTHDRAPFTGDFRSVPATPDGATGQTISDPVTAGHALLGCPLFLYHLQ